MQCFVARKTNTVSKTGAKLDSAADLILLFAELKYIAFPAVLFATFAALREGHFIRTGRADEK